MPLLRYELGGFPTVRLADPRVFAAGPHADPAVPDVRQAAARAGAAWLLHGLIAGADGAREVLVRAVDAQSGRVVELGRFAAPVLGVPAADSVLALLTRSEVGPAIGVVGRGAPLVSLEAVRAFNTAEDAFRRADYPRAIAAYERVGALDPAFALARYKRFLAVLQQEPTEEVLRSAVTDLRRSVPRVGALESRLLPAAVR
jgi:hypothetical protein